MILTDYTYFDAAPCKIQGLTSTVAAIDADQCAAKRKEVNDYCALFEPIFLTEIFGKTFYDAFIAGCAETVVPDKWKRIRDLLLISATVGEGENATTTKTSIIANYVWLKIWQKSQVQTTESGDRKAVDNAQANVQQAAQVYNFIPDVVANIYQIILDNIADYSEFDPEFDFPFTQMNALGI